MARVLPPSQKGRVIVSRTAISTKPRARKCVVCRESFQKNQPMQKVCTISCAILLARVERDKVEKREVAVRKQALKTRSDWLREAQIEFNKFIRLRDQLAGHPCISSGKPLDWNGNAVDAGHYRSRGSAPHLAFDERNCHAQSKQDNRYGSGAAADYRIGLIKRIGLAAVEALEADQTPRKHTIEELEAIKRLYRAKLKQLQQERE